MIIKNITGGRDISAKVIGIGPYWLQPDEEKTIPDSIVYVDEVDEENRPTGKKIILPAIQAQVKMGMIKITETKGGKKAPAKAEPKEEAQPEEPVAEENEPEEPAAEERKTRRTRKAE